jgi:transcriptional regulator with XRE-family HTH domain
VKEFTSGYSKLSIQDRREAVLEMRQEGMSQREIAGVIGVDQATVNRDLQTDANASESKDSSVEGDANATKSDESSLAERQDAEKQAKAAPISLLHRFLIPGRYLDDPSKAFLRQFCAIAAYSGRLFTPDSTFAILPQNT